MDRALLDALLSHLSQSAKVSREVWSSLLALTGEQERGYVASLAREVRERNFGGGVYVRALLEITSYCRNGCRYCGLRAPNSAAERYRLSKEEILNSCSRAAELGFKTFVLQGGEDTAFTDDWLTGLVQEIHSRHPAVAITLSLGERSALSYERLYAAGACRYLLRHEAADNCLYSRLHPSAMSPDRRKEALFNLKSIGYQTGSGMMIGVPGQRTEHIVEDMLFLDELRPQMIGIGPFVPASGTPFASEKAGSVRDTIFLISLLRLRFPRALIPATTALATLSATGTEDAILAGANVVMPNVTPLQYGKKYAIYDNKKICGSESAGELLLLERKLGAIGCHIDYGRGDYTPVA